MEIPDTLLPGQLIQVQLQGLLQPSQHFTCRLRYWTGWLLQEILLNEMLMLFLFILPASRHRRMLREWPKATLLTLLELLTNVARTKLRKLWDACSHHSANNQ